MYTENREFNYEPPEMIYDKATGDVTILPKKVKTKDTIIRSIDDLEREKAAMLEEMGVPEGDPEKLDLKGGMEEAVEKMYRVEKKMLDDLDLDPTNFYCFSRDLFRIDVGLMI